MATPRIHRYGDVCLRRQAQEVSVGAPQTRALLDTLWGILAADGGVGLAAPQIGKAERVVVIRDPSRPETEQRVDLVNPVIIRTFGPTESFEEGCLSFPGLYTMVMRPRGVELEYWSPHESSQRLRLRVDTVLARIIQHEFDHLDGVLFFERMTEAERMRIRPDLESLEEQYRPL